jgi:5-methylcytosine-specific restriction endonuclease McrA
MELFRGAMDLITLGNIYFDQKRTLAAFYTWAYCGSLCGYGTWRVFIRNGKGDWEEQHWITCMTGAAARGAPQNVIAPMHIADAAQ